MSGLFNTIAVVGAGAWGTALANVCAASGRRVLLWTRDPAQAEAMAVRRENAAHLPGVPLAETVQPVCELTALKSARAVLLAVPAQAVRSVSEALAFVLPRGLPVIVCAKGIDRITGEFMSEIVSDVLAGAMPAVLSGPSFAQDVARGLPTAVVLAAPVEQAAEALANAIGSSHFRIYFSTDIRGVEIGGAAKNVLAIAAGIVAGRGLGDSARAALTARGFAELARFGTSYGAANHTLMGLSGLGDLILTCGSTQSRNFSFGRELGEGSACAQAGRARLVEGAHTAEVLVAMARARGIEMPVAEAVAAVVSGELSVDDAIGRLLSRPFRAEAG